MNSYPPNQSIRFSCQVTLLGVLVNATTISCVISGPDDTIITTTVVNDSPGMYHADAFIPFGSVPGTWVARWQAAGGVPSNVALAEDRFILQNLQRQANSP